MAGLDLVCSICGESLKFTTTMLGEVRIEPCLNCVVHSERASDIIDGFNKIHQIIEDLREEDD